MEQFYVEPFLKKRDWELRFCWFNRKCEESGRNLWLKYAYRGRKTFRAGDNYFITNDKWLDKTEFLIKRIKGEV